jgi:hypothetical protein
VSTVTVPVKQMTVSDECRTEHGDASAVDQALEQLRAAALDLIERRGASRGDLFHFKLEIERERRQP